jgi:PAS domain S-box-containing protein
MKNSMKKESLLKLNSQLFVFGLLAFVLLASVSLFFIHSYHLEQAEQQHFKKQQALLAERIDKKVKTLHAATVVLANNSIIRKELDFENRNALVNEMAQLREQFAYWTGFLNYAFHVITHDGRSLYRNYDPDSYGQDVSDHPVMKLAMKDVSKSVTRIGKGGYGNVYRIINSQPIFSLEDPKELIGFMTVSQGLKQLVEEFANDGNEYFVFERAPNSDRFVVDKAPYFAKRALSEWLFTESQLNHQQLQRRDGWYYQIAPILDDQQQLQAFHLILTPETELMAQAWAQTQQVLWVFALVFLTLLVSGSIQLWLLKRSVISPMQALTRSLNSIIETEHYDKPVTVTREDEIGQVTKLFNQMLIKTDQLIFDLNYQQVAINKTLIMSKADRHGKITHVNDNFCHISGYSREELMGKSHNIVRHPDMPAAVFKELWHTITHKQIWQGEIQNRRKDGSSYFVMSYIIPILDRQGSIREYLSIREDITLIVELRDGLQQALLQAESDKQKAEQANKAKSEFLASMSHELRTPLNAIIGYAQLLALNTTESKAEKQVATILSSSKHLLALINDILDFAKLENGKVQFNFETLVVKDIVSDALQLIQTQAKQQQITLDVASLASHISIRVDRLRIKQVLLNLLSNAIKYNKPQGKVWVTCQQIQKQETAYWQLTIRDTGIGIKTESLPHLFEPFNRLGHENSIVQGSGIGLSITKDLVNKMHGWIEVDSIEGEGTTFSLFFPIMTSDKHEEIGVVVNNNKQATPHQTSNVRTLFIGHDARLMKALLSLIQNYPQLELKIAPSAQNALSQLNSFQPQWVLLDEHLAERDQLSEAISALGLPLHMVSEQNLEQLPALIERQLSQQTSTSSQRD